VRHPTRRSPWSRDRLWFIIACLALWPVSAGYGEPGHKKPLRLFDADDAQQLRLTEQEWHQVHRTRSAGAADGPRILIQKPQLKQSSEGPTIDMATPATLTVTFESNRAPVDMGSLEVTARKGFFSKSLTDLLKPYVRGTALQVQDVAIPEGRFLIEIAIADRGGAKTVETYRLQVQAQ